MRILLAVSLCVATVSLAATRFKNSNGVQPTTCAALKDAGTSLLGVTRCRMSVRVGDGGNIEAGKLVPYYCDDTIEPVELTSLACTIGAKLDAGLKTGFACDFDPGTQAGYVITTGYGVIGRDGGTGAASVTLSDAGTIPGSPPTFRTECGPTPL